MSQGRLLAVFLAAATVTLVVIGTVWPVPTAVAYAGRGTLLRSSSTPEAAVENLAEEIRTRAWQKAYASLANKAQFTEPEFVHDLTGYYPNLLTYSTLDKYEVRPLHASANEAEMNAILVAQFHRRLQHRVERVAGAVVSRIHHYELTGKGMLIAKSFAA